MFRPATDNAFATNSIGGVDATSTRAFPAWAQRSSRGDVTTLYFGAIRLQDFVHLVIDHPMVFVFDVGHYSALSLEAAGAEYNIATLGGDGDNVLYSSPAFRALAEELPQYQLSALGLRSDTVDDLADLWVRAKETEWAEGQSVLSNVHEADVFINIHDDCYAHVETRDESLADALVTRLLWTAMSALANTFEIEPPAAAPEQLVTEQCLGADGVFFGDMGSASFTDGELRLPFSHAEQKVFELPAPPTAELNFSVSEGWRVTEVS